MFNNTTSPCAGKAILTCSNDDGENHCARPGLHALSMIGNQILIAQQQPVQCTALLTTDLAGIEGKEAVMLMVEVAPGQ
jgi:hypothetical protein